MNLGLSDREAAILIEIFSTRLPGIEVRAFGSRARGEGRRFSDLDLALMTIRTLEPLERAELREALSESDLPFRVDFLDWSAASLEFRAAIEKDLVSFPMGSPPAA